MDHLRRPRCCTERITTTARCLKRQPVRRIRRNFTSPDCAHDAMLVNTCYHGVSAERDERRQGDGLELLTDRLERTTLCLDHATTFDRRWPNEAIAFVLGKDVFRRQVVRTSLRCLKENSRCVRTSESDYPFKHVVAVLRAYPFKSWMANELHRTIV